MQREVDECVHANLYNRRNVQLEDQMAAMEGYAGPTPLHQLEELQRLWNSIGVGRSGYLTVTELSAVCAHIGLHMPRQDLEDLYSKLDVDGDGTVSLAEFHCGLLRFVPPDEIQERPRAFLSAAPRQTPKDLNGGEPALRTDETSEDDLNRGRSSSSASATSGVVTCTCVSVASTTESSSRGAVESLEPSESVEAMVVLRDAQDSVHARPKWKTQTMPVKLKQRSFSLQHNRNLMAIPHSRTVMACLGERNLEEDLLERSEAWYGRRSVSSSRRRAPAAKLFTGLIADSTGCVRLQKLLGYFDRVEFHDGERLLQVLHWNQLEEQQKVHLATLAERIEEACASFLGDAFAMTGRPISAEYNLKSLESMADEDRLLLQAALAMYRSELTTARSVNEQSADHTRRLQAELDEASRRLAALIKESEERIKEAEKLRENEFASLSDQRSAQLKQLERKHQLERNELLAQLDAKRTLFEEQSRTWRDAEIQFRRTISDRDKYIKTIEQQLADLQTRSDEHVALVTKLQTDVDLLNKQLQERQVETKVTVYREKEYSETVATLEKTNRALQDKNDELSTRIEDLKKLTRARSFTKLNKSRRPGKSDAPAKTKASREDDQHHSGKAGSSNVFSKSTSMRLSGSLLFTKQRRGNKLRSSNTLSANESECDEVTQDYGRLSAFDSQSTICPASSAQRITEHSLLQSLIQLAKRDTDDEADGEAHARDASMFIGKVGLATPRTPVRLHSNAQTRNGSHDYESLFDFSQLSLSTAVNSAINTLRPSSDKPLRQATVDIQTSTNDIPAASPIGRSTVDVEQQCDAIVTECSVPLALQDPKNGSKETCGPAGVTEEMDLLRSWHQVLLSENELLRSDLAESLHREAVAQQELIKQQRTERSNSELSQKQVQEQLESKHRAHEEEVQRIKLEHEMQMQHLEKTHGEKAESLLAAIASLKSDRSLPQQINKILESEPTLLSKLSFFETSEAMVHSNPESVIIQTQSREMKSLPNRSPAETNGATVSENHQSEEHCTTDDVDPMNKGTEVLKNKNVHLSPTSPRAAQQSSPSDALALAADGTSLLNSGSLQSTISQSDVESITLDNAPSVIVIKEEKLRSSFAEKAEGALERDGKHARKSSKRSSAKSSAKGENVSLLIVNQHIEIRNQICPHGCKASKTCKECRAQRGVTRNASERKATGTDKASKSNVRGTGRRQRDRSPSTTCTSCWSFC